jgi:hypothetical protein
VGIVLADPVLWLLGAGGFLARGGFLVLALPIWTLPSAVEISTLLGPDALAADGLGQRGTAMALIAAGSTLLLIFAALCVSAVVEIASWQRLVTHADWGDGVAQRSRPPASRRSQVVLVLDLVGAGLACLLPALIAAVIAIAAVVHAVWGEIVLPGPLEVPLLVRVAVRAAPTLALVAIALVVGDVLHAVAARRVLVAFDDPGAAPGRPVLRALRHVLRHPARSFGRAVCCWLITALAVLPALAATSVCWLFLRATYRTGGPGSLGDAAMLAAATVLFVGVWCTTLLLGGLASALRAALWTASARSVPARVEDSPGHGGRDG